MKFIIIFSFLLLFLATPIVSMDDPLEGKCPINYSTSTEYVPMWDLESLYPSLDMSGAIDESMQVLPHQASKDPVNVTDFLNTHTASPKIRCTECAQVCSGIYHLKNHLLSVHIQYKPYKCPKCDFDTVQTVNMSKHIKKFHPDFPSGSIPKLSEQDKRLIEQKLAPFLAKLKYDCPLCDQSFKNKTTLTLHVKDRHKKEQYGPGEFHIETPYVQATNQARIQAATTPLKKWGSEKLALFNCSLCTETFSSSQGITKHKKMKHADQKVDPTRIDSVNKRFKQNPQDKR